MQHVSDVRARRLPLGAILPLRWQEQHRCFAGHEDQTAYEEHIDEDTGKPRITGETLAGHELFMGIGQKFRLVATLEKPIDVFTAIVDRPPVPQSCPYGEEGLVYALIPDSPPYTDSQVPLLDDLKGTQSLQLEIPPSMKDGRPDTFTIQLTLASRDLSGSRGSLVPQRFQRNVQTDQFEVVSVADYPPPFRRVKSSPGISRTIRTSHCVPQDRALRQSHLTSSRSSTRHNTKKFDHRDPDRSGSPDSEPQA